MSSETAHDLLAQLDQLERLRRPVKTGKRSFQRFMVRGDAALHPLDSSELDRTPVEVKLRDVSRSGVGLLTNRHMPEGSCWRLEFIRRGHPIGHQAVVVRHCREVQPGVYLTGTQVCLETGLLSLLGVDVGLLALCDERAAGHDLEFVDPESL